jgi:hypothetical protein
MAGECCNLVGDLELGISSGCIISVNTSCSTEITNACGETDPQEGPTTQTVSISGYAETTIYKGCPARAGVSIPWIRKYDCDEDIVYLISSGEGQSYATRDAEYLARVKYPVGPECESWSANSSSGPSSIYMVTTQINGYGLVYSGGPFEFDTAQNIDTYDLGLLGNSFYIQSFSLEMQPGQLPIANYSFVRTL